MGGFIVRICGNVVLFLEWYDIWITNLWILKVSCALNDGWISIGNFLLTLVTLWLNLRLSCRFHHLSRRNELLCWTELGWRASVYIRHHTNSSIRWMNDTHCVLIRLYGIVFTQCRDLLIAVIVNTKLWLHEGSHWFRSPHTGLISF